MGGGVKIYKKVRWATFAQKVKPRYSKGSQAMATWQNSQKWPKITQISNFKGAPLITFFKNGCSFEQLCEGAPPNILSQTNDTLSLKYSPLLPPRWT